MKLFSTRNFLLVLALLAIVHSLLECSHLSDNEVVTLFILTVAEICFLDFFMKKADGKSGRQTVSV
jgi:hypothetical protein